MKFSIAVSAFLLFGAYVQALPVGGHAHVDANIDPHKAPETAEAIREHVSNHGADSMTTKAKDLNSPEEAAELRKEAIGDKKVPGKTIDEEAPASFRKPGDPVTTKETDKSEGYHQGGVLSKGEQKAKNLGPETTITHGIKGENLEDHENKQEIGSPAAAAKGRKKGGK